LDQLHDHLEADIPHHEQIPLSRLAEFYGHLQSIIAEIELDSKKVEERVLAIKFWQQQVIDLDRLVNRRG
jgi:hypothetical protein